MNRIGDELLNNAMLKHHIGNLRLNSNASFPSQSEDAREMVRQARYEQQLRAKREERERRNRDE